MSDILNRSDFMQVGIWNRYFIFLVSCENQLSKYRLKKPEKSP